MARNDATVLTEYTARELIRAYREQRRELSNLKVRLASFGNRRHQGRITPPAKVRFKNNSSETAPAWGLLRITGGSENDYLTVDKPDATYRWVYLVNGTKDVASTGYGFGYFLTAETFSFKHHCVLYDTGATPAYGEEWGPTASQWYVSQHRPGFFILGGTKGSGSTSRVTALQLPPAEILVKNSTGSDIGAASSGTATLYGGAAGSEATLGLTISAYNRTSVTWADTKFGAVGRMNGKAYVVRFQT